ncbi:DUF3152 domain-containing protein [Streptomyces koelreuteriae]|uniref:DUF3152 domain-containing protein n=1 Tax=Streptomyces koelreuteriae TaxID=2838015 RepID=UPI003EB89119
MTAHSTPPSRSRRKGHGPTHSTSRRGHKGPLLAGLSALALLGVAGLASVEWTSAKRGGTAAEAGSGPATEPAPDSPSTTAPARPLTPSDPSSPTGSPSPTLPPSPTARPKIPATGPGTFTVAPGSGPKTGKGTALRYRVDVEDGIDLSAPDVARQVENVLADRRGWTADGRSAFRRVSSGPTDFVVKVATAGTVDKICGQYGLDTGGEVNCNVAKNVMVNLKRWLLATPVYAKDVKAYRALIINHEVGHFLGHGHVGCPGPGKPAPAMMQQIKGMRGCAPNVWPYDEQGRYLTGPAVP